ncbi:MAG: hypothetical protein J6112_06725 [Clostridia bacterium]|nr:hypothetical protein [Clostridia bacterium]
MAEFVLKSGSLTVTYDPVKCTFSADNGKEVWNTKSGSDPYFVSRKYGTVAFGTSKCEASAYATGTVSGVKAVYSFEESGIVIVTYVFVEKYDDSLHCEFFVRGDESSDIRFVYWPAPLEFDADDGCTVLPKMQGLLLPAKWDGKVPNYQNWQMLSRDFYMPFAGQVRNGSGCMMIFETPWDANCFVDHVPGGDTTLVPYWRPSLGHYAVRDKRKLSYRFPVDADYIVFAKIYRKYVCEHGDFVTLKQKIESNPNVSYMIGAPVMHDGICTMINPSSEAYDKEHPERNNHVCRFETVGKRLERTRKDGFDKLYLHLDGWGRMGYDRLHPDVFPPCPEAGGPEGMKDLSDKCRELGYRFGIHDQFRDYYFEAETFDMDNVAVDEAGGYECYNVWCGGPQTFMCPELCPQYVRRNYAKFDELGIQIDGTYLDVFSVVDLDECFNEKHTVTRKDCVKYRRECYDFLNKKGIITSSEEAVDCVLPSFVLCHHAPLPVDELSSVTGKAVGLPIPLFTLVYHECLIVPWFGVDKKGGWHIPASDSGFLYALLTGGTVYVWPGMTAKEKQRARTALALQKEVWDKELVSHEFIDGNPRRQRSVFAGGTVVTVDFDTEEFEISHASN